MLSIRDAPEQQETKPRHPRATGVHTCRHSRTLVMRFGSWCGHKKVHRLSIVQAANVEKDGL